LGSILQDDPLDHSIVSNFEALGLQRLSIFSTQSSQPRYRRPTPTP
jgi:hypothetical protein